MAYGDARIDMRIDGSGAHAVVLLAGFPLAREIWDAVAQPLAATHRVLRPDLRGMGASSVVDGPYLMELLASDVATVLDAVGVESAAIVGHSAGGYVALAFARMYAERVDRLALVCSRLVADSPDLARSRKDLASTVERDSRIDAVVEAYVPRLLSQTTLQRHPEIAQRVRAIAERADPRGAAALLRGIAMRSGSEDIAPELTMPVLVIAGGEDAIVPLDEERAVAAAFPNATLVIAERSGHLPMLEEPDVTTSALADWLKGRITPASCSGS
ncbi:MAG TPA: alpha/beta hydrolase [Candidatus Tyrphobacter sp.]